MVMKSQDHQLIALSHILFRYRLTGELPNIDGKPFNLEDFKSKLFSGISIDSDSDINININSINSESNVTVVENQTVECNEEHSQSQEKTTDPEISTSKEEHSQSQEKTTDPEISTSNEKNSSVGGKLFQFFSRD